LLILWQNNNGIMELLLSICLGIGLSAACGFRVFVPFLIMSIASLTGHLELSLNFQWIGTHPALVSFAVACVLEIGGYYIAGIDNLLDTIATPAAIIAGMIAMASIAIDMSPFLKWTLAIIAGGGTAAVFQGKTVLVRGASTATTGGAGNFAIATAEAGISALLSLFALLLPLLTAIFIVAAIFFLLRKVFKRHLKKRLN
jgi:hypothetical protein